MDGLYSLLNNFCNEKFIVNPITNERPTLAIKVRLVRYNSPTIHKRGSRGKKSCKIMSNLNNLDCY